MPEYRRSLVPSGSFFFILVTLSRAPIFTDMDARALPHSTWVKVRDQHPFQVDSVCLLPEHFHYIWPLPEGDADYSIRWREIKRIFTHTYLDQIGSGGFRNGSRQKPSESAVWQRR